LDENNNIEETINMNFALILFQLIKDKYFKKGNLHLTSKKSIKPKILSYEYYHNEYELLKIKLDKPIIEGDEEVEYHENYDPPCRRYLSQNFSKNKQESMENFQGKLHQRPSQRTWKLFKYINYHFVYFPPDETETTLTKASIQRALWKSQI
jgi:hypothetical protein